MTATAGLRALPRRSPRPEDGRERQGARPGLRVVDKRARLRRARRRQARVTFGLAACIVAGAFLVVAAANSLVVSQQVRLDAVRSQVAATLAQDQDLQVQRAMLESPARILAIAEHQLGMVTPSSVRYLSPVVVPGLAAPPRAQAATRSKSKPR